MILTMELIELQTLAICEDETIINENGEYKSTSEVYDILHSIWLNANNEKKRQIEKLVAGTPYKCS